jgi:hypothetical protein
VQNLPKSPSEGFIVNASHAGRSLCASLALFALPSLCAQAADSVFVYRSASPGLHAVQHLGITVGGNVISKLTRSDGSIREISAGGLYQIGLGVLYQAEIIPFSTALTLNYHYNSDSKDNDNATFRRIPLETIVYFNGLGDLRIGGGMRYNYSSRADSNLNGVNERITFENSKGSIVEIGYQVRPGGWVSLRHVKETYKVATYTTTALVLPTTSRQPYNGEHTGLFLSFEY